MDTHCDKVWPSGGTYSAASAETEWRSREVHEGENSRLLTSAGSGRETALAEKWTTGEKCAGQRDFSGNDFKTKTAEVLHQQPSFGTSNTTTNSICSTE